MRYVLCHILVFLLCVGGLSAQTVVRDSAQVVQSTQASVQAERTAWNTVHLELLGNGLIGSISYEGAVSKYLTLRLGLGFTPLGVIVPITLNGFIGERDHLCEISAGAVWTRTDPRGGGDFELGATFRLGYRYQPLHGGFNFGAAFTPFILSNGFQPWGGISLGWGF